MKFEILLSCMHQKDFSIIEKSNISGNVTVINQCNVDDFTRLSTKNGTASFYSVKQRGLTKSRNMAIDKTDADVCLLCDDDEVFVEDYEGKILGAYNELKDADVIIFKMVNRVPSFSDKIQQLKFPKIMKVSSWQISFKKESLVRSKVRFDELLGAGTGNGGEEELKFLLDCQRAGLKIYYVPIEIASVSQTQSTWFGGFNETFFENRGATTRYILGYFMAVIYAFYYVVRKRNMYKENISMFKAFKSIFKGINENKIEKQKQQS